MKILIDKIDLERILISLSPFLDKKGDPITSSFYLIVKDGKLTVKATNLKSGLSTSTNSIIIKKEGETLVDGARLIQVIKPLKRENISLTQKDKELEVKQGRIRFRVKTISNIQSFPSFPKIDNMSRLPFNGELLKNGFEKILPSIDGNSPKYEITGGLISISNNSLFFVSTDTKRLTVVEEKIERNEGELELIIPRQAIIEIPKLFDGDIEFTYNEDFLIIESGEFFFFTKLINGEYPNWKRIIPNEYQRELLFNRDEFIQNLKLISTIGFETKVTLSSEGIKLETLDNPLNSQAETFIETPLELDENIVFGVNNKFILDFLHSIDKDSFNFGFNEPNRPFSIWSENLKAVIMPINL